MKQARALVSANLFFATDDAILAVHQNDIVQGSRRH